jgi:flavin-dependent dehydrogenase
MDANGSQQAGFEIECDVAVIGAGPGGTTLGSLLRKYDPALRVVLLEREKFPREHVGESQLPPIGKVLDEMGCWDDVEAADFPIKVGGTFRWGKTPELWDFEFLPIDEFHDEPRPAKYVGQRQRTAFQVDRAIYDHILMEHARKLGCDVREETRVVEIEREGERVTAFRLKDGSRVRARWYVDASGHTGVMRRALGIETTVPTSLRNIAIWDYWDNAKWAVEIGVGGTRIQVMSLKHGWLWFIPLGPTRTSVGFVCPADHYKASGKTPEELYAEVCRADERIAGLLAGGTVRGRVVTTKDWSFVSSRAYGENWFLVGEALGFADPILSAGLTLTHTGARELAYTILALDRGEHERDWLLGHYEATQRARVIQHIRFADFWYAANGQFTDLQENCRKIASDAGLKLGSYEAWRWLAQGGFALDDEGQAGIGGCDYAGIKQIVQRFTELQAKWSINQSNVFKLNLLGAREGTVPIYDRGEISAARCFTRGPNRLVLTGLYEVMYEILRRHSDIAAICEALRGAAVAGLDASHVQVGLHQGLQVLEAMNNGGWITGKFDPRKSKLTMTTPDEGKMIHRNVDGELERRS